MFIKVVVYLLTGIVGLCVGSFLNVVIYRVPLKISIAKPGSHCTSCGYMLKWYDNIPVISYICLRGRCRKCGEHISFRYTLVEIGNTLLWLACLWQFGYEGWQAIVMSSCAALACSVCLCIAFIDLEHKIIFDRFQIMMLLLAALFTAADTALNGWSHLWPHLIGAAAAGLVLYLIGLIVSRRVGREALGGGDVKFAFCAGLFIGWEKLILMMIIASVAACIMIIIVGLRSKKDEAPKDISEDNAKEDIKEDIVENEVIKEDVVENEDEDEIEEGAFAFGPFLTGGFAAALIFGELLINTYLGIIGLR